MLEEYLGVLHRNIRGKFIKIGISHRMIGFWDEFTGFTLKYKSFIGDFGVKEVILGKGNHSWGRIVILGMGVHFGEW